MPHEAEAELLRASGLADEVVVADARDPIACATRWRRPPAGPADITVVCVDVPGCEGGAILATAAGGTVVFFSMATSFSAAALGAEGLAADVTMLVGNGYVPGHADYAHASCSASNAGVRRLFEGRLVRRMTATQAGARPRPGRRPAGARAGPQGRPADRQAGAAAHDRLASSAPRCGSPGSRAPTPRARPWVNRLARRRPGRPDEDGGLEHGVALPVWDALVRGEAEDLATLAQKASAGSVRFRLPEGRDAAARPAAAAAPGRRRAQAHRRAPARAGAADQAARRRPAHSRGST